MAYNLDGEGLIGELHNKFNLLIDREKGVINFESPMLSTHLETYKSILYMDI